MKISYNGLTVEVDEKDMTPESMASVIDMVVKKGRELSGTQGCSLKMELNGPDLVAAINRTNRSDPSPEKGGLFAKGGVFNKPVHAI